MNVVEKQTGNGAREALSDALNNSRRIDRLKWVDHVLARLWLLGFKIVPIEE